MSPPALGAVARPLLAAPGVTPSLSLALVAGGLGAAYPAALLAEPDPPGLAAGLALGAVGAGLAAPLWCGPLAVWLGAGGDPSGVRVVLHAAGVVVLRRRGGEVAALGALVAFGAVAGAAGGLVSTAAQRPDLGESLVAGLPSAATALAALAPAAATGLGWLLGVAVRNAAAGIVLCAFALAASFAVAGLGYFTGWARELAVFLPFGSVVPSIAGEFMSRQYAGDATAGARLASAVLWIALVAAAATVRTVRSVR